MSGVVYGLDLHNALAGVPEAPEIVDRDFVRRLLLTAEAAFIAAVHKRENENPDE